MPRFSILTHDHPFLHWDFLLEAGNACRTWRLLSPPDSHGEVIAEALSDHRLMYLNYQGPVSGDRGHVSQWDSGSFEWRQNEADAVEVDVAGSRIQGRICVRRTADKSWIWFLERTR